MATAAMSAAMSYEHKKDVVHPFFLKTKQIAAPPIEDDPSAQRVQPEDAQTIPQDLTNVDEKKAPRRSGPKNIKRLSGPVAARQATLDGFSAKPASTPATEAVISAAVTQLENDNILEEDLNYDRRKRRKTALPERFQANEENHEPKEDETLDDSGIGPRPSWAQQLIKEAYRVEHASLSKAPSVELEGHQALGDEIVTSLVPTSSESPDHFPSVSAETPTIPVVTEKDMYSNCHDGAGDSRDNDHALETTTPTGTPPKKPRPTRMLRLKNGKLASPESTKPPIQAESEVRTRPIRIQRKQKQTATCIIIMKYPERAADHSKLGERINGILDGVHRFEKPSTKPAQTRKPSPKRPSDPPKPTHPFFMGKAALVPVSAKCATAFPDGKPEAKVVSPRKLTGTPGRIRAQAEAHRATLSAPSFGHVFGSSQPRMTKYPGMREAPWPWEGAVHVRGEQESRPSFERDHALIPDTHRKLKGIAICVNDGESLITKCARDLYLHHSDFPPRRPQRLVTTGSAIQKRVSKELRTRFCTEESTGGDYNDLSARASSQQLTRHPVLQEMYSAIEKELTPFDNFECEIQAWTHKYAPTSAMDVLQVGKEAIVLRDWLQSTTITAVDTGSNRSTTGSHAGSIKPGKVKPEKKKKRKRVEDLDDFIVSSEDELACNAELAELEDDDVMRSPQKRSLIRGGNASAACTSKSGNAILLSGPNGCGKTAAVYAIAKELGFEVFELNAGSRRSGKDVLDKVGDMTENHLVQQVSKVLFENKPLVDGEIEAPKIAESDVPDAKQGSMTSFFMPTINKKKPGPKKIKPSNDKPTEASKKQSTRQQQRQSLILFEEVDVLFEEDKQFWLTVLSLAGHSKRPIIMTCNNEDRIPLAALSLHAILRFAPAPIDLAVDYLLLLAAREGHLLNRATVESLYQSRNQDLRGSIMELDHWCQLGVGDSTGGFHWMLERYPPGVDIDEKGNLLRVVSQDTYLPGMGLIPQDLAYAPNGTGFNREDALCLEVHQDLDPKNLAIDLLRPEVAFHKSNEVAYEAPQADIDVLRDAERRCDLFSALDVSCGLGLRTGSEQLVDTTHPKLSEKIKASYIIEMPVLYAEPPPDYTRFNTRLAISAFLTASRVSPYNIASGEHLAAAEENTYESLLNRILLHQSRESMGERLTRDIFSTAFDLLASDQTSYSPPSSQTYPLTASSFDREFGIQILDLAPYVRLIAAHDLKLEAQRLQVSSLLSAGGSSGAKRLRMTRASRSAMEGGKRQHTRRERWFDKELNLARVMETGGKEWAGLALEAARTEEDGSERSGNCSTVSSQE